ncbi:hypothetical protein E2C01_069064 [Portunus trituberculatus]|uniref:Uncharacterized protein n=1 Tax=Portunus trituberculatus TaxID=210409 RepID=A0A5B7HTM9_PORTR|nr:hypothetical protein [Portunus trituberculatus]
MTGGGSRGENPIPATDTLPCLKVPGLYKQVAKKSNLEQTSKEHRGSNATDVMGMDLKLVAERVREGSVGRFDGVP